MKLRLEKINLSHENEIERICKEYEEVKDDYNGAFFLKNITDYKKLVKELEDSSNGIVANKNYVPGTCFVALNEENKIVGVGSLRHCLNENLKKHGGHIGYSVVPSERKKGYGTEILRLLIEEAKKLGIEKILVTCDEDNIASKKVIEKNGGVLENKVNEGNRVTLRFWIENR